jgi:hypothetical protein
MSFWLAWMVDICAGHADNRQALFQEDAKGCLNAIFVDNGHLFGGPKGEQRPCILASRYLDPRIYQRVSSIHRLNLPRMVSSLDVKELWQRIEALPPDWKTASALDGFAQCLDRLLNLELLQNAVDTMVDAHQRTTGSERHGLQGRRRSPIQVLCPGVQAAELARRYASRCIGDPACV